MRAPNDTPSGTPNEPPKDNSTVLLLLGTIADTTWRMFVPIIGLLMVGVWIDKTLNTPPIGIIVLAAIGIGISAVLVRRQLINVNKK